LSFPASAGTITAPFVLTSNYISQPVEASTVATGGQVTYTFNITNAGPYLVQALINAPSTANNSFWVNIDGQPQDPAMIWDTPLTSGFQWATVSWRGNGTDTNDQFVPNIFTNLTAGVHQLVIVGREANVQLQSISITRTLLPPAGLHRLASSP
jgi:hypothetical protein